MKTSYLLVLVLVVVSCGKNKSSRQLDTGKRSEELSSENSIYSLLKDSREKVTFPALRLEDRQVLLDQSKLILGELYVNRLKKMKTYGAQIDPLPMLEKFERLYFNSSPKIFHQELANIYSSQRDHHTWYNSPAPGSCFVSFLPFSVVPAKDSEGANVSVIKSVRAGGNTLALAPEIKNVSVGDVLLSLNGKKTKDEIKSLAPYNSGSNQSAFYRSGHNILTYRNQASLPIPQEDKVVLELKKPNGEIYSIEIPWLMFQDNDCLKNASSGAGKNPSLTAENTMIIEYEKFYKPQTLSPVKKPSPFIKSYSVDKKGQAKDLTIINGPTQTLEPTISWWSFKNEHGTFGVIKLDSFSPEKSDPQGAKSIIANLMTLQMAECDGIIFDLRNNGGGNINYGQSLAELISAKPIEVLNFQLLNTRATRHYFEVAEPDSPFAAQLKKATEANLPMTAAIPLASADAIFTQGQSFFKPVAIFTNSNCYSTCDMMSALFQDHALAEVWAEDAQTGAGGANNWNHKYLIGNLPQDKLGPYQRLPFDMNIGFAFRQTVRTGIHQGELLEDEGVKADHILETTVEDILNNGQSQFEKISQSLAAKKADYQSWVSFASDDFDTYADYLDLRLNIKATDSIQIFHQKKKVWESKVTYSLDMETVSVRLPMNIFTKNFATIEIKGVKDNSFVWRKVIDIRKTAAPIKIESNEELSLDLDSTNPFVIYNKQKDESLGWEIIDHSLKIGSATEYENNVASTASLFVDLSEKSNATLSFDMEFYTEKRYDTIGVFVRSDTKTMNVLSTTSGAQELKNFQANLSEFSGKKIEILFVFRSDEYGTDKGVWVKNIKIK